MISSFNLESTVYVKKEPKGSFFMAAYKSDCSIPTHLVGNGENFILIS